MTFLYKKEYIIPFLMLLVLLLVIFEPTGYDFIAFAVCSLLLSYAGFIRRKTRFDTIAIISGLVLFVVFFICFFIQ